MLRNVTAVLSHCLPWLLVCGPILVAQGPVPYDIVYVKAPRLGDETNTQWPEVFDPIRMEPGADLILLHPNGSEEVLFDAADGAVVDPAVSFDGEWVFFSYFPDLRQPALNYQRRDAPRGGADIYKINLDTRTVVRLTQQQWTPPSGASNWSQDHLQASPPGTYYLGYGIFNLGPCPLPDGKLMFSSSRDGYLPNKSFTFPNLRLYIMDQTGQNVEKIGHLNIGSALHPTVLMDGRVMFSSYEAQGLRDRRLWVLWSIWPDGRHWEPLMSAFSNAAAMHFQTQLSDGGLAVVEYYNLNNNGFGTLLSFDPSPPAGQPPFGDPDSSHPSNPSVRRGIWFFNPSHPSHLQPRYKKYPFSPPGLHALTGFTHGEDNASSRALDGSWAGKVTHPSSAPNNDVLLVWSPGPANDLNRPTNRPRYDGGIYLLRNGQPIDDHSQLILVKNDPDFNEMQPRPLVTYSDIYGIEEPASIPFLPNDGGIHPLLERGTPFGLVGTSSFYKRNSAPAQGSSSFDGLDPFNTSQNGASTNWGTQGAEAGLYQDSDIYAVRIVATEGVAHRSYGPGIGNGGITGFRNHADAERLRILGEIPLRKYDSEGNPVIDPDGNPDTSVLLRIPADVPFTFQTLDKDGLVLNSSQTWHQVRPGEVRNDCGGCHAHAQVGTDFSQTAAASPTYQIRDVGATTPILTKDGGGQTIVQELQQRALDVEYYRDIKPILQRSCVACHSQNGPSEAGLVLDDEQEVGGYENTYNRLANDSGAQYGIPPVISNGSWRQTNASRYIRKFQSRRSLLIWKIFGRRLDGWTNQDHPTESVPGDPGTLPGGANPNNADIDFTGTIMPLPGSNVPPLSEDEKMMFARWVDLGCPISTQSPVLQGDLGWFVDDLKPTLTVSSPRAGLNSQAIDQIRVGMFDSYSGLDRNSLSVVADFPVNGRAPGSELGSDFSESGDHIWSLVLDQPITDLTNGLVTVKVNDVQGNENVVRRAFSVSGAALFDFALDSLSVDGNILGRANPDGVPDFLDHFDDGSLVTPPTASLVAASPLAESGGFLRFRDTDGSRSNSNLNLDIAILGNHLTDGGGDAEIKASFRGDDPALLRFYGVGVWTADSEAVWFFVVGLRDGPWVFVTGPEGLLAADPVALPQAGSILLKMFIDDDSDQAIPAYSLDGGASFKDASQFQIFQRYGTLFSAGPSTNIWAFGGSSS